MKKMLVLVPALIALVFGCSFVDNILIGSGNLVEVQMNHTGFNVIDIDAPFEVTLIPSAEYSVTIVVDDNILDHVRIAQTDQILSMDLNAYHSYSNMTLKAFVTAPSLRGLELSGASMVTVIDSGSLPSVLSFEVEVRDASHLILGTIVADTLSVRVENAGRANVSAQVSSASIVVGNASSLQMGGSADDLTLVVENASAANLKEFSAANVSATVSGTSEAWVRVDGTIRPDITGASQLYYHGSATFIAPVITGASSILQY